VRVRTISLAFGTVLALAACSPVTISNYSPKSADEEQIVQVFKRMAQGVSSRSPDLIMQAYADDVYVGNFNKWTGVSRERQNTTLDKAGLKQVYTKLFKATGVKDIAMEVTNFTLTVTGDRAAAEGRTEFKLRLEGGRKEVRDDTIRNDVVWRMKRGPAGWKIVEEVYQ